MRGTKWFGVAALVLLLAAGCSSDDNSSLVGGPACIGFVPAASPAAGDVVAQLGAASDCTTLVIEFRVTGVTNVYSTGFRLTYDPFLALFLGADAEGSFLGADGVDVEVVAQSVTGETTVGVTRVRDSGIPASENGVDAVAGNDLLVTLTFAPVQNLDSQPLTIDNEFLAGPEQPGVVIAGVDWFGGTLTVGP